MGSPTRPNGVDAPSPDITLRLSRHYRVQKLIVFEFLVEPCADVAGRGVLFAVEFPSCVMSLHLIASEFLGRECCVGGIDAGEEFALEELLFGGSGGAHGFALEVDVLHTVTNGHNETFFRCVLGCFFAADDPGNAGDTCVGKFFG